MNKKRNITASADGDINVLSGMLSFFLAYLGGYFSAKHVRNVLLMVLIVFLTAIAASYVGSLVGAIFISSVIPGFDKAATIVGGFEKTFAICFYIALLTAFYNRNAGSPTYRRRLRLVLLALVAITIAGTLLSLALLHNVRYLLTPTDVAAGQAGDKQLFRLGGVVCEGSVRRTSGTLAVRFIVTDRVHQIPVRYTGILPDLFREGQSIIATGHMKGDGFRADEILAKHDETYMPKEVADAIAKGKTLPHTPCAPPP